MYDFEYGGASFGWVRIHCIHLSRVPVDSRLFWFEQAVDYLYVISYNYIDFPESRKSERELGTDNRLPVQQTMVVLDRRTDEKTRGCVSKMGGQK